MNESEFLFNTLIYLFAAVIAVPIFTRLGLGSVLGYLVAGIIIGPSGLGIISHVEDILHFAEFGVVLLLFLIGLELNPSRLWSLKRSILVMGTIQVVSTTLVLCAIAVLLGLNFNTALIAGMCLSLSSTAIVMQILTEKNLFTTDAGHSSFSILLFQDIAIIPMLAIIPLLGPVMNNTDGNTWLSIGKAFTVITLVIVGGRYLTRPFLRMVASTRLREIFTALSLLIVIGIALLMQAVNMSMALGTFLAGVVLAESEYRHELEIDIEPFKGLLLGLFFISVGMSVNLGLLLQDPIFIIGLMLGLIVVKMIILFIIGYVFGIVHSENYSFSFILSQGGEFAFVLLNVAASGLVFDQQLVDLLMVVVALSMITTPLLMLINERFIQPRFQHQKSSPNDLVAQKENPVIIAGYGRFGQIIGRLLHSHGIKTTILDHDPVQVETTRKYGGKAYYGDASRIDLLKTAGAEKAKLLVLSIDDPKMINHTVEVVSTHFPHLTVLARARNRTHAFELMNRGIKVFVRETFYSALEMGEQVLKHLGYNAEHAKKATEKFRKHDIQMLYDLYPHHQDEKTLISIAKQARQDFNELMQSETADPHKKDPISYD